MSDARRWCLANLASSSARRDPSVSRTTRGGRSLVGMMRDWLAEREHNDVETLMRTQAQEQPERILPDPAICRAARVTETLAECLVSKPFACEYAMPFGYGFLCGHPDRRTIIEGTRSAQMGKGRTNVSCEAKN